MTDDDAPLVMPVEHDPFEAAAYRQRQAVQPEGGRQIGLATRVPEAMAASLALGIPNTLMAGPRAMAQWGNLSDEEKARASFEAAASMVGPGMGIAPRGALGAAGAKMVQPELAAAAEAAPEGIRAYHGSPHDFERFDISKIGTGEGAQAYGHGLYFAENPATAQAYKDNLVPVTFQGQRMDYLNPEHVAAATVYQRGSRTDAIRDFRGELGQAEARGNEEDIAHVKRVLDILESNKELPKIDKTGRMYEVSIKAHPDEFLDWDKSFEEQSPKVQEAIKSINPSYFERNKIEIMSGSSLGESFKRGLLPRTYNPETAMKVYREAGIPGIKYLDQGSRNVNGLVNLETKYRAANLDNSSSTVERFFASRFKENEGSLDRTVAQLRNDLSKNPDDETIKKTLAFAQDTGNKFTYEPPKAQTRNYVVFNDKLIDILKKYGIAGIGALPAMGAYHFQTQQVDHNPFSKQ